MDDKRISIWSKWKLGLVYDTVQSNLSIQRILVGMQTSEFQQWTEESKMELESSCFDEMVKGVLTSSMGNEDACNSRK